MPIYKFVIPIYITADSEEEALEILEDKDIHDLLDKGLIEPELDEIVEID